MIPCGGALFETLVVGEFIKQHHNTGQPTKLFSWRALMKNPSPC